MPQAPAQPPQATQPAKPKGPATPTVPPEFDALPIWMMEPAKLLALVKDPSVDRLSEGDRLQEAVVCRRTRGRIGRWPRCSAIRSSPATPASAWSRTLPLSVDDAFRAALPKLKGKLKIGVITRSASARTRRRCRALTKLIDDSDCEVAQAAAASVGMIGGAEPRRLWNRRWAASKFRVSRGRARIAARRRKPAGEQPSARDGALHAAQRGDYAEARSSGRAPRR